MKRTSLPLPRRELLAGLVMLLLAPSARAQELARVPRLAILRPTAVSGPTGVNPYWQAFFSELGRLGFTEGKNLVVEWNSGEGRVDRYAELARDVVSRRPDIIFALSTTMARYVKGATETIPIVGMVADPIVGGLTASLARPAANVTGVVTDAGLEIWEKRVALLKELVPSVGTIGFLAPKAGAVGPQGRVIQEAARRAGLVLTVAALESPIDQPEYARAFEALARARVQGVIVDDSPQNFGHKNSIIELAATHRLAAMYSYRDFADAGGLAAYAIDLESLFRYAAGQIVQILKGTSLGEIPFYRPTTFKLVVNVKTAKALGITLSPTLLAVADEVIE